MKFSDVKFVKSVALESEEIMFDEKNEIIFVGRSNVGKSSIMNALFEKKDLVKTSSRPGKTKTANLFIVENKYYMTDLPGYGFAKLGKNLQESLDGLISWYLEERKEHIKKVVILIDSKLGAQQTDIDMYKYLLTLELPLTIVLSKTDKIGKNEVAKSLNHARNEFFGQDIFPVSSTKKTGLRELEKNLKAALLS
ncbi:MAG: YihA family ribosome biogenesis GTP-binding protein [Candidatus Gracilibacteria bacterium]|nr:YihA family ribosome biogenesis GTP-binding protein [Candidatus Gracilibacteria bacterium]